MSKPLANHKNYQTRVSPPLQPTTKRFLTSKKICSAIHRVDLLNECHETALNLLTECSWTRTADNLEILKLFHKHGANLDHVDHGGTGLMRAVAGAGYAGALLWLVKQDANLNLSHSGETALRPAVIRDPLDCMEIVLEGGADPNAPLEDDETVLFMSNPPLPSVCS